MQRKVPSGGKRRPRPNQPVPRTGRELARQVLARVEEDGAYAGRALAAALDRAPDLSPAERGLGTELFYGVLRRRARLDRALDAVSDRGLTGLPVAARIVLRVGAYQLLFLDRVPAYAAVDDAVGAAKVTGTGRFAGLTNALLRRVAERGEPPLPDPGGDPLGYLVEACGLPEWLARLTLEQLPQADAIAFADALATPAPVALRTNRVRATRDEVAAALVAERPDAEVIASPVAPDALLGRGLDAPARTRAFETGLFAIQDVGAQLVAALCGAAPGERILDACAGVGGKTAYLAALANNAARIDAVDRSPAKLGEAERNARRLGIGLGITGVTHHVADLAAPLPPQFGPYDRILLDAPCAGLGVLRRHPETLLRRSEADLHLLAATQRQMLGLLAPRVAPGGLLVYAVCTFDHVECEDVVRAFLAEHPDFAVEAPGAPTTPGAASTVSSIGTTAPADAAPPWASLVDAHGFVRTWPHKHDADAFFAVRLRRRR